MNACSRCGETRNASGNWRIGVWSENTVDGWNPANQLSLVVNIPLFTTGFKHPNGGCWGFLPSSIIIFECNYGIRVQVWELLISMLLTLKTSTLSCKKNIGTLHLRQQKLQETQTFACENRGLQMVIFCDQNRGWSKCSDRNGWCFFSSINGLKTAESPTRLVGFPTKVLGKASFKSPRNHVMLGKCRERWHPPPPVPCVACWARARAEGERA